MNKNRQKSKQSFPENKKTGYRRLEQYVFYEELRLTSIY